MRFQDNERSTSDGEDKETQITTSPPSFVICFLCPVAWLLSIPIFPTKQHEENNSGSAFYSCCVGKMGAGNKKTTNEKAVHILALFFFVGGLFHISFILFFGSAYHRLLSLEVARYAPVYLLSSPFPRYLTIWPLLVIHFPKS